MAENKIISDEQVTRRVNCAVKIALEKKRALDIPVVAYDRETQSICVVAEDGSKTAICGRYTHGRYSERTSKKA